MSITSKALLIAGTFALVAGPLVAQPRGERVDFGKREFESNCASCHGVSGKGDGILRPYLTKSAPDLTTESKRNGGVFPMDRLYQVIEGANVPAHGAREMPVWGRAYRMDAAEYYVDVQYDPQAYVRARILALLEYLNRIQVK